MGSPVVVLDLVVAAGVLWRVWVEVITLTEHGGGGRVAGVPGGGALHTGGVLHAGGALCVGGGWVILGGTGTDWNTAGGCEDNTGKTLLGMGPGGRAEGARKG